jgi:hypothetical protein
MWEIFLRCHFFKKKNYEKNKVIGVNPWHLFTFGNFFSLNNFIVV